MLGAAGGVEFVVCAKSVEEGYIHQTMGTKETDEECDLDYTIGAPKEKDVVYAMSNSLGFGGISFNFNKEIRKRKGGKVIWNWTIF